MGKSGFFVLILLSFTLSYSAQSQAPEELDLLIVGARVFDGSGNPWEYRSVGIRGDSIVWVAEARVAPPPAGKVLQAEGLYLAPGFIDLHSHTASALGDPALSANLNYLYQGVTTLITGNDGGSPWPVGEALQRWEETGTGPNAGLLVGHGTIRQQVLGMEDRRPGPEELERMRALVRQAMEEGALGLSAGLFYAPGSYADTAEAVELAREAARLGGYFDCHIRDESNYSVGLLEAVREAIEIGRRARLPVHLSHLKALGPPVWGQAGRVIEAVERARSEGVEVTADQYPYEASSTGLVGALIPRWGQAGGPERMRERIRSPELRPRLAAEVEANLGRRGGGDRLLISSAFDPSLEGKTLAAVAAEMETDAVEAVLRLVERGTVSVVSFNMQEEDLQAFMRRDWVATASDGSTTVFGRGKPHPRGYGTFPRKIRRYALEEGAIGLAFAIRAATSLPASIARIPRRGWIREGYHADLVVFDLDRLADAATYEDPHRYAEGVSHLLVNGVAVIEAGKYTGALPGRVLRR